jgi:hypothetical protein
MRLAVSMATRKRIGYRSPASPFSPSAAGGRLTEKLFSLPYHSYQPITMFDSITFLALSRSVPVSCM